METISGKGSILLAQAFAYPSPGLLASLADVSPLGNGEAAPCYRAFLRELHPFSLGEWEELYTRTFDLNPFVAPYVGYQAWGDHYRRGPFLALMNRALAEAGVSTTGELPDHIAPVLRYLAVTPAPAPELMDVLGPAVERMVATLKKAAPDNPYLHLLEAVQAHLAAAAKEAPAAPAAPARMEEAE